MYDFLRPPTYERLPNTPQSCYKQFFLQVDYLRPKTKVTDFEIAITNPSEKHLTEVESGNQYFTE